MLWIRNNGYLHIWLLPLNGLQYGTPYAGCTFGNIPEFMSLDNSLNRYILSSLRIHSVWSRYILEETNVRGLC